MTSYQDLLQAAGSVESSARIQAQGTINISEIAAENVSLQRAGYGQLLATIDRTLSEAAPQRRPTREGARQAAAAQMQQVQVPEEAAQATAVQVPQVAAPAYGAAHAELKEKAKRELTAVTGELAPAAPATEEARISVNLKELVLPNLPIAEQVPELEKIIEGIRSNIFDADQTATLKEELTGLRIEIADEKAEMQRGRKQLTDSEKELWAVREQRLTEAAALVK